MLEFFEHLPRYAFLQTALLSGLLASVACGIVGSYVVVRRISYMAGGIAHCILGGLGAAYYLQVTQGWEWLNPLYGAFVAALLAAAIIGFVSMRARQREDTVIGALWAVGMAIGVVFMALTPGYQQDLTNYLFGSALLVQKSDLWLLVGLDVLVVGVGLLFYQQFKAVCFDEEFARLRGINVETYYITLLMLTAVTVVLLTTVVGVVLVIALLTLPAAIAGHFVRTLGQLMVLATLLCMGLTTTGLAVSYVPDLPPGATTILLAGALYLVVVVAFRVWPRRRVPVRA